MDAHKTYPAMPIKATPYQHQRAAFEFACRMFELTGGDADARSMRALRADDPPQGEPRQQP